MKRFIKNNIKVFVAVIISGIVFTGVGVYAASQYFAKDISFTPTNENFKKENGEVITNAEDALNTLYSYTESKNNISDDIISSISSGGQTLSTRTNTINLEKGEYIVDIIYDRSWIANTTGENTTGNSKTGTLTTTNAECVNIKNINTATWALETMPSNTSYKVKMYTFYMKYKCTLPENGSLLYTVKTDVTDITGKVSPQSIIISAQKIN